jgi:hypothetical protein
MLALGMAMGKTRKKKPCESSKCAQAWANGARVGAIPFRFWLLT